MSMIAHLTTVHSRNDTRIRLKEAASLAAALEAEVVIFVQDGQGNETDEKLSVRIIDTGPRPSGGRIARMISGAAKMYRAVRAAQPDIVHFHDPELIPIAFLLRLNRVSVIYDVHEDLPRQILSKHYIPAVLRRPVSLVASGLEQLAGRIFNGFMPATPAIGAHFPAKRSILIQNFPLPGELVAPTPAPYADRPPHFAYVGGISAIRSTRQMVDAIAQVKQPEARLKMAGKFMPDAHRAEIEVLPGWARTDFEGWADRPTVATLLGGVRAGLVLFQPLPNHTVSQPNKLFEYMGAGLPVIASDFPLWRQLVGAAGSGLLVDPQDPAAIAQAMEWILDNPEEAEEMGQRGKLAVETTYNWPSEAAKLVAFYHERLGVPLNTGKQKDIS